MPMHVLRFREAVQLAIQAMTAGKRVEVHRKKVGWGPKRVSVYNQDSWGQFWKAIHIEIESSGNVTGIFWAKLDEMAASNNIQALAAVREIEMEKSQWLGSGRTFLERVQAEYFRPYNGDDASQFFGRDGGPYTPDWEQRSVAARSRKGWKCEVCGIVLRDAQHLLHVHHCDHNRQNNSESNLRVVCVLCHSRYRDHGHLLNSVKPSELKRLEEWQLPLFSKGPRREA